MLARYWIETDDGVVIAVENEGWLDPREQNARLRTTLRFQCDGNGRYAHLLRGCYAASCAVFHPTPLKLWCGNCDDAMIVTRMTTD